MQSPYMNWAKLRAEAPYNLATSGVLNCTLADLGPLPADLELHGANAYGYAPFVDAVAARFAISPECVVTSQGASMSNHLAFATLLEPGDAVLVEDPTYELLLSTLSHLGATLRRFERRAETGFALEPEAVRAAITPATRLIVLTHLHNPTGARTDMATLAEIGEIAAAVGARVLIDEVYLELTFADHPVTAFQLGETFVVTSSLTKAYGLSGLRAGWILAAPDLAQRMRRLNDLYGSVPVFLADQLAALALQRLDRFRDRASAILSANHAAWRALLGGCDRLDPPAAPAIGTTVFPRLIGEEAEAFVARLRTDHDTSVAPGRFFERPDRFRVGLAGDPVTTRAGLERLARALETTG